MPPRPLYNVYRVGWAGIVRIIGKPCATNVVRRGERHGPDAMAWKKEMDRWQK